VAGPFAVPVVTILRGFAFKEMIPLSNPRSQFLNERSRTMNRFLKLRSGVVSALALALLVSGFAGCKKPAGEAAPGAAVSAAGAAKAASGPGGGETPEAVVARMKKGAEDKNMAEVVACMAPKARQEMSAAMYLGSTMMVAFSQMGSAMGGAMMEGMTGMAEGMGGEVSAEDKKKAEDEAAKMKTELAKLSDNYNTIMKKHGLPVMPKEGEPEPAEPSKEELDKLFANLDHGAFITDVMALMESMPGEKSESDSPFAVKGDKLENLKIEGDKATGTVGGEAMNFVQIDGRWFLDSDPMGMGGPGGDMGDDMGGTEEGGTEKPGI